jgi:SAM-dependent methyltransferase
MIGSKIRDKILNQLFFTGSGEILIADFGCADMKFASHLLQEVNQTDQLKGLTFKIFGFDLTSDDIMVPEELQAAFHIKTFNGIDVGDESHFVEMKNSFDFVISTCALWGSSDSWKNTIKNAFQILKQNGHFLLAEKRKRLPRNFDIIETAGVDYNLSGLKIKTAEMNNFRKVFLGLKLTKEDDFDAEHLISLIPGR